MATVWIPEPTPPIQKGLAKGVTFKMLEKSHVVWIEEPLSQYPGGWIGVTEDMIEDLEVLSAASERIAVSVEVSVGTESSEL